MLKEHNIPTAKYHIVNRDDQPQICQSYLEKFAKDTKNRGEELLKFAEERGY